jgi:hypothetical protein
MSPGIATCWRHSASCRRLLLEKGVTLWLSSCIFRTKIHTPGRPMLKDSIGGAGVRTNTRQGTYIQSAQGYSHRSQTCINVDEKGTLATACVITDTISQLEFMYARANTDLLMQAGCLWPRPDAASDDAASFALNQGTVSTNPTTGTRGVCPRNMCVSTLLYNVPGGTTIDGVAYGAGAGTFGAAIREGFAVQSVAYDAASAGQTAVRIPAAQGLAALSDAGNMVLVAANSNGDLAYKHFRDLLIDHRWLIEQIAYYATTVTYTPSATPPYARSQSVTYSRMSYSAGTPSSFQDSFFVLPFLPENWVEITYPVGAGVVITSVVTGGNLKGMTGATANIELVMPATVPVGGPKQVILTGTTTVSSALSLATSAGYAGQLKSTL